MAFSACNPPTKPDPAPTTSPTTSTTKGGKTPPEPSKTGFTRVKETIIRGDRGQKKMALIFSADHFAEGGAFVREVLAKKRTKASFFLTGRFYRDTTRHTLILGLKQDGHYLGGHSDQHLEYGFGDSLIIGKQEMTLDLKENYKAMEKFGLQKATAPYFLPPYEWYDSSIAQWTKEMGLTLIGITPGSRSNADYTTPEMPNYLSSNAIWGHIKTYEQSDPDGLNGFIMLLHMGTAPERTDKFYKRLGQLLQWLKGKGYELVRIDELLGNKAPAPKQIPKTDVPMGIKMDANGNVPADYCPICRKLHQSK